MKKLKIGIIGVGRFGRFLLSSYKEMKNVEIYAISSRNENQIKEIASRFNIPKYSTNYHEIIKLKEIDVIVIATPPFLHAKISIEAIKNKKAVLCEKPLSITLKQAEEIKKALKENKSHFTIDYLLRKNPLIKKLKKIIDEGIFGSIQNFNFENYAAAPPENHWFWDKKKSGGIWIEHGVHFFDLARHLLSQDIKHIKSFSTKNGKEDKVECIAIYTKNTLAHFSHSFTKQQEIEETNFTLSMDKATIRVSGWIPLEMKITGITNKAGLNKLEKILKKKITPMKKNKNNYIIKSVIKLKKSKTQVYKESVKEIMSDLINNITKKRKLEVGFKEAYESLKDAIMAEKEG